VSTLAEVRLWGRTIGAVSLEDGDAFASFQYDPAFAGSGIQVSPLTMPLGHRVYRFPSLPRPTFHGLPGLLADSLPDKFGNALIDAWLATQGRSPESFNAVERLCYTGTRGMGALEFAPVLGPRARTAHENRDRRPRRARLGSPRPARRPAGLLRRPGAQGRVKRHPARRHLGRRRAGQGHHRLESADRRGALRPGAAGPGFGYWLLKFDGVTGNKDKELDSIPRVTARSNTPTP
jgi:serine/threonine-protein kinase HipA